MKTLNPKRPSALAKTDKFSLFSDISCRKARELFDLREEYGPLGHMQLKDHMVSKIVHEKYCPSQEAGALEAVNALLDAD